MPAKNVFPKEVIEIRFHARAGQGAKSAAQVMADAAIYEGGYAQAFPFYGPERRGSPVSTFVRISPHPIDIHCFVQEPDFAVVLDSSLIGPVPVAAGLDEASVLMVNTPSSLEELSRTVKHPGKTVVLDASEMASYFLGRDLPNIIMLGPLVRGISELWGAAGFRLTLTDVSKAVKRIFGEKWGEEVTEKNIVGMKTAFKEAEF